MDNGQSVPITLLEDSTRWEVRASLPRLLREIGTGSDFRFRFPAVALRAMARQARFRRFRFSLEPPEGG
jgi:hypothetical protein